MKAEEALKIYLGGNMNTCTLKPLAIIKIMEAYAKQRAVEFELFLMKQDNDINMNPESVGYAYDEFNTNNK